jgi:hypothetical protein
MRLQELEQLQEYNYSLEEDTLQKLSMAKTDTEKKFLRTHLCELRGIQSDLRRVRLTQLKTEN